MESSKASEDLCCGSFPESRLAPPLCRSSRLRCSSKSGTMVTPLVKRDVIKKRVKKFKRMQSDRKICVKVLIPHTSNWPLLFARAFLCISRETHCADFFVAVYNREYGPLGRNLGLQDVRLLGGHRSSESCGMLGWRVCELGSDAIVCGRLTGGGRRVSTLGFAVSSRVAP